METTKILNLVIPILLMVYVGFCWIKQGFHARGRGWITRMESPKMFWFNIILLSVISMSMIVWNFIIPGR